MAYIGNKVNGGLADGNAVVSGTLDVSNDVTLSADVTIDTNTLIVDSSNNKVGIGGTPTAGTFHIFGTSTTDQVIIENTNTGAGSAPDLVLFRKSTSSAADNDVLGRIDFRGLNDANEEINYATIFSTLADASDGTENGKLTIQQRIGSSYVESFTLNGDGNVGIGTNSPSQLMEISSSSAPKIRINNSSTSLSADTSIGGLEFNTNDASSGGTGIGASIEAKADGNFGSDQQGLYLAFSTRDSGSGETNTERMRIEGNGVLKISDSSQGIQIGPDIAAYTIKRDSNGLLNFNATQTTFNGYIFDTVDGERMRILSGGGLTFNGDTATANALDDYEEGTYTPSLSISGSTSGISINASNGTYTKIGRLVVVTLRINLDSKGSNSGRITATLPFGCQNASVQHGAAAVYYLFNFSSLTDGNVGFAAETNLAQGGLFHTSSGSDLTGDTNINNNSQFAVTISYVTN